MRALHLRGGERRAIDALFTTRGDIVWNDLGKALGAKLDEEGQIITDVDMRTSVRGLYARGMRDARELSDDYCRRTGRHRQPRRLTATF